MTVHPPATVMEAVRTMDQESIGAIAVMGGTFFAGMFSERDLMLRVVGEKRDPEQTRIRDVMMPMAVELIFTIHRIKNSVGGIYGSSERWRVESQDTPRDRLHRLGASTYTYSPAGIF